MTSPTTLPRTARALGYSGLLPQAAAALCLAIGPAGYRPVALAAAMIYAALIFSFLGALWWGLAAAHRTSAPRWIWPVGVLPSIASLTVWMPWVMGVQALSLSLGVLATGIAASALVDLRLEQLRLTPTGWFAFRLQLSLGLGALTALCALS